MKKIIKLFGIIVFVTIIGFSMLTCENGDDPPEDISNVPTVALVTVSTNNATVLNGESQQITATVIGTNSPAQTVTWTIITPGKHAGTTINGNGLLTVAAAETLKTLTIRATSTADTSKYGQITINLIPQWVDKTADEIVAGMTFGWNLGDTLDMGPDYPDGIGRNPLTTQENIDTLKNAGFNTLRIPVSWSRGINPNTFEVNPLLMQRAIEIADYAVKNDMYIIINSHHDNGLFRVGNAPGGTSSNRVPAAALTPEEKERALEAFRTVWEQIADNFKYYNEKLIFEALNEPRTYNSSMEWNGGSNIEHELLKEYYQLFVDTVRASGGYNDKRSLMVTTYAASATQTAMNGLRIPDDTIEDRIIISIHAYEPYGFTLQPPNENPPTTWNPNDTSAIRGAFDRAETIFINNGYPVIMGEFGAVDRSDVNPDNAASRIAWAEYYVGYARSKGIPCILWDNGNFGPGGEHFGFLDRRNNTFPFPEYRDALLRGAGVLE